MTIKQSVWFTTNEVQDCLKALQLTLSLLKQTKEDSYYWKWVLVALHNSVQGFMVCALRDKDGLTVLKDKVAARLKEAKKTNGPPPKLELDTFLNLYKKIQSDLMLTSPQSKKFCPNDSHNRSIRRLNRLRNHFVHFTPRSWSTEMSTFPLTSFYCLKVIRFLAFSSRNINFSSAELTQQVKTTMDEIEFLLEQFSHES